MPFALYCTRADLTAEGFDTTTPSTDFWDDRIEMASQQIEDFTGRWFGAIERTLELDGAGTRVLQVPIPIVSVSEVLVVYEDVSGADPSEELSLDAIRVYNRHLTQGLTSPDDRDAPQLVIETFANYPPDYLGRFPEGNKNIHVTGKFGYTELASTDAVGETVAGNQIPQSEGSVPKLIKRACMMLVQRMSAQLADVGSHTFNTRRATIKSERTRDESVTYGGGSSGGSLTGQLTGDYELDSILSKYRRPARMALLGDSKARANRAWY